MKFYPEWSLFSERVTYYGIKGIDESYLTSYNNIIASREKIIMIVIILCFYTFIMCTMILMLHSTCTYILPHMDMYATINFEQHYNIPGTRYSCLYKLPFPWTISYFTEREHSFNNGFESMPYKTPMIALWLAIKQTIALKNSQVLGITIRS